MNRKVNQFLLFFLNECVIRSDCLHCYCHLCIKWKVLGFLSTYILFFMHWSCECKLCLTHSCKKCPPIVYFFAICRMMPLTLHIHSYNICTLYIVHGSMYHSIYRPSLVYQLSSSIYLLGSKSSIAAVVVAEYL